MHPGGFEPPTARFVAEYSIQLSYGCIGKRILLPMLILHKSGIKQEMVHPGGCLGCASPFGPLLGQRYPPGACDTLADHETLNSLLFRRIMVHPGGFEPPTARFVAEYSIQLSYGCKWR